jgi:Family of unknown function (DUF6516)
MPRRGDAVARARLLRRQKWTDNRGNLYEVVLWQVERGVRHPEGVRYRLAFIRKGEQTPALVYDNHHPKGHHRHVEGVEQSYSFTRAERLVADFTNDADKLGGKTK